MHYVVRKNVLLPISPYPVPLNGEMRAHGLMGQSLDTHWKYWFYFFSSNLLLHDWCIREEENMEVDDEH